MFVERAAKPRCRLERPEASHWVITLLDTSIILFHPIVEVLVCSVLDFPTKHLANGVRVRAVSVNGHPLVSEAPQHNQENDVSRELEMIERSVSSLIEDTVAFSATENLVAQRSFPG